MIQAANPRGVGWVELDLSTTQDHMGSVLDAIMSGHGVYRPVEAPACGAVDDVAADRTTDRIARQFVCDRPAGHDDAHRHIYTVADELIRDGHDPETQAWWTALRWNRT